MKVYGSVPESGGRNENIELPDYEEAAKLMATRKNMTLMGLWFMTRKEHLLVNMPQKTKQWKLFVNCRQI